MKKKKFGQKIQNWHRPLGPSQLPRRFLRHRYDEAGSTRPGEDLDDLVEVDDYWDCCDPRPGCYHGHPNELFSFHLDHLWRAIAGPLPPHIALEPSAGNTTDVASENAVISVPPEATVESDAEERLAAFVEKLVHLSAQDSLVLRYRIVQAIGATRNLEVVTSEYSHAPEAAKRICLFAPFWRRSPQTWNKAGGTPLLDHLFVLYAVPRFLYAEWFRDLYPRQEAYYGDQPDIEGEMPRFKWLCWFILLGQGSSLRRAAECFDWRIPPRFGHCLQDVPAEASPVAACVFAEVKRLGGSEIDAARILDNPAFVIDPTEFSAVESHWTFWQDTVRWLIAHRDAITDEQSDQILSWAMHQYTEAEQRRAQGTQPFSWKGRSVRAVLERIIEYRRQISRPLAGYTWQAHGWDWGLHEGPGRRWTFCELTSSDRLFDEGQALHHCVASYAALCASGHSAIVSLAHNDIRRVTVELDPRTRQIKQARGAYNRPANEDERRVIQLWIKTVLQPDTSKQAT